MGRESSARPSTTTRPAAVIVQQGKVLDYIDEVTQRKETPEEYVRQQIKDFLNSAEAGARAEDATPLRSWTQRAR